MLHGVVWRLGSVLCKGAAIDSMYACGAMCVYVREGDELHTINIQGDNLSPETCTTSCVASVRVTKCTYVWVCSLYVYVCMYVYVRAYMCAQNTGHVKY